MQKSQPRDDYREFLELLVIFLGSVPPRGLHFSTHGAVHSARWMAKIIYCFKIMLFKHQFKLTREEEKGLTSICIFIIKVYAKAWFRAPLASTARRNDLHLLKSIARY